MQVLVGEPEGKRPLGRPRRRWEDNIKMDLQEVGCGGMDWIELAQTPAEKEAGFGASCWNLRRLLLMLMGVVHRSRRP